jgi:hypothetical protein
MVLSGTVRGSDPRARLVGRDAYIAAGGRIERELFDDDDSESWADVALLESLAAAKMEEQAKALAAEQGLAWVKPTLDPYASHDLVEGWSGFRPNRRRSPRPNWRGSTNSMPPTTSMRRSSKMRTAPRKPWRQPKRLSRPSNANARKSAHARQSLRPN